MSKVKPIPDGYHTVTPYLIVKDAARWKVVATAANIKLE